MNASSESGLWATVIRVSDHELKIASEAGHTACTGRTPLPTSCDHGRDAVDGEVDVGVGGRAAEAEADRRAGALADGADGLQHVRRRLAAGTARGAGRHREIAERHQQRLALDVVEADVQVVRQARRRASRSPARHRGRCCKPASRRSRRPTAAPTSPAISLPADLRSRRRGRRCRAR